MKHFIVSMFRLKIFQLLFICLMPAIFVHAQIKSSTVAEFKEMPDPSKDSLSDWSAVKKGLNASFVTIDKRFPKHLAPAVVIKKSEILKGWRGERISAQILLWTAEPAKEVQVKISEFKSGKDRLNMAKARFERYVMTDEFGPGCGYRKPQDFPESLSPDMLDDLTSYDLKHNSVRPVWLTIDIPRDAKPGIYHAKVVVEAAGNIKRKLELTLEVLNHTLPKPPDWTYHLDLWQHPSAVARVNQLKMWSDEHFATMKPLFQRLADAGQKVITATLNKDPWNVQTYDPYADMIIWTKNADNSWSYDYSVFDRWVQMMLDLGINKEINAYSIIPWNSEIHYKDGLTGKFVDVQAKPGTPEFAEYWEPFLRDFVSHLKQKGWLLMTNIALDERSPEQMKAASDLVEKVAPELGLAYADNHKSYKQFPNSKDVSIGFGDPYSRQDIVDRNKKGFITTYYVSCADGFPNTFTFSDPAEATFMAWYALASGFDGLLRWSYNSWVKDPLQDSRFRTWPAGDTYIVYPQNRSSIRFERLREGIQDYQKAQIILEELKAKDDQKDLNYFKALIEKLNQTKRFPGWNEDLNNAKAFLNSF